MNKVINIIKPKVKKLSEFHLYEYIANSICKYISDNMTHLFKSYNIRNHSLIPFYVEILRKNDETFTTDIINKSYAYDKNINDNYQLDNMFGISKKLSYLFTMYFYFTEIFINFEPIKYTDEIEYTFAKIPKRVFSATFNRIIASLPTYIYTIIADKYYEIFEIDKHNYNIQFSKLYCLKDTVYENCINEIGSYSLIEKELEKNALHKFQPFVKIYLNTMFNYITGDEQIAFNWRHKLSDDEFRDYTSNGVVIFPFSNRLYLGGTNYNNLLVGNATDFNYYSLPSLYKYNYKESESESSSSFVYDDFIRDGYYPYRISIGNIFNYLCVSVIDNKNKEMSMFYYNRNGRAPKPLIKASSIQSITNFNKNNKEMYINQSILEEQNTNKETIIKILIDISHDIYDSVKALDSEIAPLLTDISVIDSNGNVRTFESSAINIKVAYGNKLKYTTRYGIDKRDKFFKYDIAHKKLIKTFNVYINIGVYNYTSIDFTNFCNLINDNDKMKQFSTSLHKTYIIYDYDSSLNTHIIDTFIDKLPKTIEYIKSTKHYNKIINYENVFEDKFKKVLQLGERNSEIKKLIAQKKETQYSYIDFENKDINFDTLNIMLRYFSDNKMDLKHDVICTI